MDAVTPFVQVRASTTKNGKPAHMRLLPELAAALGEVKSSGARDDELVFQGIPRIERFYRDLKKAGIALQDALGRKRRISFAAAYVRDQFGTRRGGKPGRNGADAAQ